jgi:elongation factor Ts
VKVDGDFAAIIALKCETDFVANNADFVKLTQDILDAAVAARCKTLDEVKALPMGDATVQDAVVARSGITGEKMELDGYSVVEGASIATYDHQNKHTLCVMVALNKAVEDATVGKNVAMQIASANPVAIDQTAVPQETIDSDDHIESNMAKGWITPEQAAMVRELKVKVAEEKAANLPEQMIQNIAQGRLKKFFKENCLLEQEYIWDKNQTVAQYLHSVDKELTVTAFKRFTLRAE